MIYESRTVWLLALALYVLVRSGSDAPQLVVRVARRPFRLSATLPYNDTLSYSFILPRTRTLLYLPLCPAIFLGMYRPSRLDSHHSPDT